MNFYCSAVDDLLRHTQDAPTVGLILCQNKDRVIAEYALRDIMTSPMEGLDDTGLAYFIRQRQVEKEQGGLF